MTVLLVLLTLTMFLVADHFVQKSRERAAHLASQPAYGATEFLLPPNVDLATNHTWMKREPRGITTIGLDEFLGRLVGAVENIVLPQVGASLTPAAATISLRDGKKSLALAAPVGGRVVAINERVLPFVFPRTAPSAGRKSRVRLESSRVTKALSGAA